MQKACREYPAGISQRPVYMPYVKRNAAGEIVAVSALEDADAPAAGATGASQR